MMTSSLVKDNEGKPTGIMGTCTNITERKQAEEALAAEAIRRRILMEQSHDGIVVLDQDGSVYESNQRFAEMLGFSLEEVSHLHVWDWEFQFTPEQVRDMLRNIDETGDNFETQHRRKDGTIYDVEISTNGAVFAGEKLIFCVCRDVTERKRAEEALLESEQRFRRLFDDAPLSYQSLDKDGCFIDVNNTWCSTLGYTREEVLGRNFSEFISPDYRGVFAENFPKFKEAGESFGIMFEMVKKNKSNITASFEGRVSYNSDGSFKQTHSILVDVTERERMNVERELLIQQMNKRMKELHCLYLMAESISTRSTIEDIFYDIVMTIPYGFQHPLIARARIRFDDEEYVCKQLDETEWRLASDLMVNGEKRGSLEVYYLEQQLEMEDGPFLQEEHKLVDTIAKTLSRTIERTLVEADIKTKVKELEEFNSLSVGRELRMIELKREINQLLDKSGSTNKYEIVS